MYSVCILIYVSMYLCIYVAIHLHTVYIWTGCRWCLSAIGGAPQDGDGMNLEMYLEAMIVRTWTP
jgi:hypothetical protein